MPDEITLRPVTADDLDLYEQEFSGPEGWGTHSWFGFQSTADLRRRFAENGLLGPDGGLLSVAEGDVTVGRVKWFPGNWGPADLANWSLAIGLVPSARGRGTGTRAQRLLAEYLFDHTRPKGSRPGPTVPTSPSSERWRRRASSGRACCAPRCGAAGSGAIRCSTPCSARSGPAAHRCECGTMNDLTVHDRLTARHACAA